MGVASCSHNLCRILDLSRQPGTDINTFTNNGSVHALGIVVISVLVLNLDISFTLICIDYHNIRLLDF